MARIHDEFGRQRIVEADAGQVEAELVKQRRHRALGEQVVEVVAQGPRRRGRTAQGHEDPGKQFRTGPTERGGPGLQVGPEGPARVAVGGRGEHDVGVPGGERSAPLRGTGLHEQRALVPVESGPDGVDHAVGVVVAGVVGGDLLVSEGGRRGRRARRDDVPACPPPR